VIVDSHLHLWDLRRTPQPWMTDEHASINRSFGPDDLVPSLERNGIDRVIVVQGACTDADTDFLFEEAGAEPWLGAVTAWVCLEDPARAQARLDVLSGRAKFRAVRHLIHNESDHWIVRPTVLESIALLEERGLILELPVVYPRHFDDVRFLAERFPGLRLVVDHLGKPPLGTEAMAGWEGELRTTAEYSNVLAKVSGLNTAIERPDWTADDLLPAVEVALDCFGAERLMWGSDWPVLLLNGDYDRVWDATRRIVASVAAADAPWLLGGTAARVYHLDPPPGASSRSAEKEDEWQHH
jgi:L-fuconolactonase